MRTIKALIAASTLLVLGACGSNDSAGSPALSPGAAPLDTARPTVAESSSALLEVAPTDANSSPIRQRIESSTDRIVDLGSIDITLQNGGIILSTTDQTGSLGPEGAVDAALEAFPTDDETIVPKQYGVALGVLGGTLTPGMADEDPAGHLVYVVVEPRVGTAIVGGVGEDGNAANPPTVQLSDRYVILDATTGAFIGATEVASGTNGNPPE